MNNSNNQDIDYDVWAFLSIIKGACPPQKKKDLDKLLKQMIGDKAKILEKIQEWWEETAQPAHEESWEAVDKKKPIKKKPIVSVGVGSGDRRDHASRGGGRDSAGGRGGVRDRGTARKGAVKSGNLKPPPSPQPSVITGMDTTTILSKQQPTALASTSSSKIKSRRKKRKNKSKHPVRNGEFGDLTSTSGDVTSTSTSVSARKTAWTTSNKNKNSNNKYDVKISKERKNIDPSLQQNDDQPQSVIRQLRRSTRPRKQIDYEEDVDNNATTNDNNFTSTYDDDDNDDDDDDDDNNDDDDDNNSDDDNNVDDDDITRRRRRRRQQQQRRQQRRLHCDAVVVIEDHTGTMVTMTKKKKATITTTTAAIAAGRAIPTRSTLQVNRHAQIELKKIDNGIDIYAALDDDEFLVNAYFENMTTDGTTTTTKNEASVAVAVAVAEKPSVSQKDTELRRQRALLQKRLERRSQQQQYQYQDDVLQQQQLSMLSNTFADDNDSSDDEDFFATNKASGLSKAKTSGVNNNNNKKRKSNTTVVNNNNKKRKSNSIKRTPIIRSNTEVTRTIHPSSAISTIGNLTSDKVDDDDSEDDVSEEEDNGETQFPSFKIHPSSNVVARNVASKTDEATAKFDDDDDDNGDDDDDYYDDDDGYETKSEFDKTRSDVASQKDDDIYVASQKDDDSGDASKKDANEATAPPVPHPLTSVDDEEPLNVNLQSRRFGTKTTGLPKRSYSESSLSDRPLGDDDDSDDDELIKVNKKAYKRRRFATLDDSEAMACPKCGKICVRQGTMYKHFRYIHKKICLRDGSCKNYGIPILRVSQITMPKTYRQHMSQADYAIFILRVKTHVREDMKKGRYTEDQIAFLKKDITKNVHAFGQQLLDIVIKRRMLKPGFVDDAGGRLHKGLRLPKFSGIHQLSLDRKKNNLAHIILGESITTNLRFIALGMNTQANIVGRYGNETCDNIKEQVKAGKMATEDELNYIVNEQVMMKCTTANKCYMSCSGVVTRETKLRNKGSDNIESTNAMNKFHEQFPDNQSLYMHALKLFRKQKGKCAVSKIIMRDKFDGGKYYKVSLDAIDPKKHHVKDNLQLICCFVNCTNMEKIKNNYDANDTSGGWTTKSLYDYIGYSDNEGLSTTLYNNR